MSNASLFPSSSMHTHCVFRSNDRLKEFIPMRLLLTKQIMSAQYALKVLYKYIHWPLYRYCWYKFEKRPNTAQDLFQL